MRRRRIAASRRTKVKLAVILAGVVLALLLIYQGGRWLETRSDKPEARGEYSGFYSSGEPIEVDATTYLPRQNVTTLLLMGIDRNENVYAGNNRNGGQADFLRLLVLDADAQRITQVQLDRDTMTPITILGVLGNKSGTRNAQLCLAHGFGDGGEQSCELTVEAVSNLLLGTKIDFYMALDMEGIGVLNDWVGGVTVTLEDDFSALDPTMTEGKTLTLTGEQAEIYVRGRRSVGVGTNEARMARQEEYIAQLTDLLDVKLTQEQSAIGAFYDALEPYLTTDLSRGRLINEFWAAREYERAPLVEPEGNYQIGEDGFMQFLADEESLQKIVLELFYQEVQ